MQVGKNHFGGGFTVHMSDFESSELHALAVNLKLSQSQALSSAQEEIINKLIIGMGRQNVTPVIADVSFSPSAPN